MKYTREYFEGKYVRPIIKTIKEYEPSGPSLPYKILKNLGASGDLKPYPFAGLWPTRVLVIDSYRIHYFGKPVVPKWDELRNPIRIEFDKRNLISVYFYKTGVHSSSVLNTIYYPDGCWIGRIRPVVATRRPFRVAYLPVYGRS